MQHTGLPVYRHPVFKHFLLVLAVAEFLFGLVFSILKVSFEFRHDMILQLYPRYTKTAGFQGVHKTR